MDIPTPSPETPPAPTEAARILAFDLGRERIGVAISDGLGLTAQPLLTIYRKTPHADLKSIGRLIRRHAIAELVVGNPLHLSGDQSPQAARAQRFADDLRAEFGLPVHLWDERLTSHAAHEILDETGGKHSAADRGVKDRIARKRIIDQLAAVLILESFLAARGNPVKPE
ncbi:MAG TPA: Holliday junction resolvase RuvX [Acidobacteriaceae bacterium]|nr:Holliday junction resolvase RuvX [Acidobacteriaceae bacterium]